MRKYVCTICGYIYDEAAGIPSAGIAPGTRWESLPDNWACPLCGASKADFKEQTVSSPSVPPTPDITAYEHGKYRELSAGEISAVCSNLARGCEKQYLSEESALFTQLADYFRRKTPAEDADDIQTLLDLVQNDLASGFPNANAVSGAKADRGALRALVWSEKVSRILNSLLGRYEKEGDALLENTNVYVCEICGFIYIGDNPPDLCPVCKVPNWKIAEVERR
ncbi:MAG: rubredoxin [Oscillospiraceae bacterium]